jgi:hypothetical protein
LLTIKISHKRVQGIMTAIFAAWKLAEYKAGPKTPATICAIAYAVIWADQMPKLTTAGGHLKQDHERLRDH